MRILILLFIINTSIHANDFDKHIVKFINKNCLECHGGKKVKGKVDFTKIKTEADALKNFKLFESALELIHEKEMPPEDEPQPSKEEIETFESWYKTTFVKNVKAQPAVYKPRRLSVNEYRNTLRSLFGFDLEVAVSEASETIVEKSLIKKVLPPDPPGESGFRNDTTHNPLTTEIWNGYSYIIDIALERLFIPQNRQYLEKLAGKVNNKLSSGNLESLFTNFITLAFSRPANKQTVHQIIKRISTHDSFHEGIKTEMKAILMSPQFIYRGMLMPKKRGLQAVDNFEYIERLSYFIWADLPDRQLYNLALSGEIRNHDILSKEIDRMLADPKSRNLSEDFSFQWLALSEMNNISRLRYPIIQSLKAQVLDFTNYLFTENRPIIELIDSKVTFANQLLRKYYQEDDQINKFNKKTGIELVFMPHNKISLTKTPNRGGIITMPGILAMNASQSRTSPVLRGTWILERILGDHLPEPPMDVGKVPENKKGQKLTFRQRFELHKTQKTCAVCHDKIDPLGFALEAYDPYGYDLTITPNSKKKKPQKASSTSIDTSGIIKGHTFKNFNELKGLLTSKYKKEIIRNVVRQTMSYALHRKLEYFDTPTVEKIVSRLYDQNGTYKQLIMEVITSIPFEQTIVNEEI